MDDTTNVPGVSISIAVYGLRDGDTEDAEAEYLSPRWLLAARLPCVGEEVVIDQGVSVYTVTRVIHYLDRGTGAIHVSPLNVVRGYDMRLKIKKT